MDYDCCAAPNIVSLLAPRHGGPRPSRSAPIEVRGGWWGGGTGHGGRCFFFTPSSPPPLPPLATPTQPRAPTSIPPNSLQVRTLKCFQDAKERLYASRGSLQTLVALWPHQETPRTSVAPPISLALAARLSLTNLIEVCEKLTGEISI